VIAEVAGRTTDFVVRSDGAIMHALAVIYVVRATEGVAEFKLIQHAIDAVEVLVVPEARWSSESAAAIVGGLRQRLGDRCRVTVRLVNSIAPESSGKFRYVVSHVPLAGGLGAARSADPLQMSEIH
jgi:phenylacetate-CoA ligase